jgi:antitoxin YefM
MRHTSLTDFRANIARHLDAVENDRVELIVTRQNHEPCVVMPLAELEGLRETLHLLGSRASSEHLLKSIAELEDEISFFRTSTAEL